MGKTEVCIDDEIPFELPDSWAVCRCNQILSICTGKKDANYGTPTGTFPFFTCSATPIKSDTYSFDGKSLILPGNGANVGMCLYYEGKFEAYQRTYVLQPFNDNSLNIAYVKLIFDAFWREYNKEKMFGSAIPYIKLGNIERFILPIPPLHEQERIVAKIHVIDKLVEDYAKYKNAANTLNEQLPILLRKSILQYAIQGKLVPQAPSDEPASVLLERIRSEREKANGGKKSKAKTESYIFKNSDDNSYYENYEKIDDLLPFEIPDSWRWCRLGELIDFSKNKNVSASDIAPDAWVLDLEDIEKDSGKILVKKRKKDLIVKSDKHEFNVGNVLYSKLRPYLNKVVIADEQGYCTSEILAFDFGEIIAEYAQIYLMSPYFVDYAMSDAYGVKMPRVGSAQGNAAFMPIPPIKEQERIVLAVKKAINSIAALA